MSEGRRARAVGPGRAFENQAAPSWRAQFAPAEGTTDPIFVRTIVTYMAETRESEGFRAHGMGLEPDPIGSVGARQSPAFSPKRHGWREKPS